MPTQESQETPPLTNAQIQRIREGCDQMLSDLVKRGFAADDRVRLLKTFDVLAAELQCARAELSRGSSTAPTPDTARLDWQESHVISITTRDGQGWEHEWPCDEHHRSEQSLRERLDEIARQVAAAPPCTCHSCREADEAFTSDNQPFASMQGSPSTPEPINDPNHLAEAGICAGCGGIFGDECPTCTPNVEPPTPATTEN